MNVFKNISKKLLRIFTHRAEIAPSKNEWKGSADYWNERYLKGGNSGAGSYNRLAEFKAEVLNDFVSKNHIQSIVEWGCGDGNQLSYANYPKYIGIDVSVEAINLCRKKFSSDANKGFYWSGASDFRYDKEGDLALSLDVIYHLIEDNVYEQYMKHLFASSTHYVCIYSCNDEEKPTVPHVKHRCFSKWVEENEKSWQLMEVVKNRYPYDPSDADNTSWSDFYFYKKCE